MTKEENEKRLAYLKGIVSSLPEKPGSYQYYDENHVIIYVGKAKNLKSRVSSYFHTEVDRYKTKVLVSKIWDISYTVVNSEDLPAFNRHLGRLAFDKEVAFTVVRGGQERTFRFAPTEKGRVEGAQKAFERWGFTAKEINRFDTPDLAFFAEDGGLFVSAVAWDGNAWSSGLKEKDVIVSLVQGMSNKEIADHLCISTNTVITHRRNIARKLQIHSPAGLTIYAIVNGLIDISSVKL